MLLYHSQDFEGHNTGSHPECIERITRVNEMLSTNGWLDKCSRPEWKLATPLQCQRIHTEGYLTKLQQWCEENAGRIEVDTVVSDRSWNAALMGAGAACDAVERVIRGEDSKAFCAIRPPGHHAVLITPWVLLIEQRGYRRSPCQNAGARTSDDRRLGHSSRQRNSRCLLG